MDECWLKSNRRAVWPLLTLPALIDFVGAVALGWGVFAGWPVWSLVLSGAVTVVGAIVTLAIARWSFRPRLAYSNGELLVYVHALEPLRVPIDVVEVFFRGQSDVPLAAFERTAAKTSNVIVRLAEADTQWHRREIPAAFGKWADGYIILSGTMCEPISLELLRQLNGRLMAIHRARRGCSNDQTASCGTGSGLSTPCEHHHGGPGSAVSNQSSSICPGTGEPCGTHAACPGSGAPCETSSPSVRQDAAMEGSAP